MWNGKAITALHLANQAIDRLDGHMKTCEQRDKMVDAKLDNIERKGDERHQENVKKLDELKSSAMWTMISVLSTITVGLLSAVVWLAVKLLHV